METKVLVLFYSLGGSTQKLADAVAEGAAAAGATVRMRRAADFGRPAIVDRVEPMRLNWERMLEKYPVPTAADMEWADAIILGSPGKFGGMASELKSFLDTLGPLWMQNKLANKFGGAFATTSNLHGGKEMTLQSLLTPMMHLGLILVTPGYLDPVMHRTASPYGATSTGYGQEFRPPTEDDLTAARFLGRRVTEVTRRWQLGATAQG